MDIARELLSIGFSLCATQGTKQAICAAGLACTVVKKVREGSPHIVDMLKKGGITLIINTTEGRQAITDSGSIRRTALQNRVYYTTTLSGARAVVAAIQYGTSTKVRCLQTLYGDMS